jgi:Co/Zn/Cd efflux system component
MTLIRVTAFELLDIAPTPKFEDTLRAYLAEHHELRVLDLHLWSIGRGKMVCIIALETSGAFDVMALREAILKRFHLNHLTIELRQAT